jgi:Ca-activated chloride channel homolog
MTFAWAPVLLSLLALPLLVGGYVLLLRRRRRRTVVYSSVALIRAARPTRAGWRRHVPFGLLCGALACLGAAGARPQAQVDVPLSSASVIIALDVSGSMCATDVDPNRLSAAQAAVRRFIQDQNGGTRIGLVVFSGFAQLAVPPTTNRGDLLQAVDTLTTGRGTTIGAAILKSLDAIAQINPAVAPAGTQPGDPSADGLDPGSDPGPSAGSGSGSGGSGDGPPQQGPPNGRYAPEIIVLLTDGANTRGVTPLDAAQAAAARGVRVYPIGFGTTDPTTLVCTAAQLGGNAFNDFGAGRFGLGGMPRRAGFLVADEPTLKQVATTTGGTYFAASDAGQLKGVLSDLPRQVQVQKRDVELSAPLAGLAGILVLLAVGAAVRWSTIPG